MFYLLNKSATYRKNQHYKTKPKYHTEKFCTKIIYIDSSEITFTDNRGNFRIIHAEYLPLWGYDIYAEILCDFYNSLGLNVNTCRCLDYFEEAKSSLNENDYIAFCNYHKKRWKELKT